MSKGKVGRPKKNNTTIYISLSHSEVEKVGGVPYARLKLAEALQGMTLAHLPSVRWMPNIKQGDCERFTIQVPSTWVTGEQGKIQNQIRQVWAKIIREL